LTRDKLSFNTELVAKVISNLKRGKAPGIDGLTAEHLLFSHPALSVILCRLFRLILLTLHIPRSFKYSYVVPIPKPKDFRSKVLTFDDFRGIAISPIISKVFEHCFLETFESLLISCDNQFGFKKGLSCSHAVFTLRSIVDSHISKGCTVNLSSIDVSNAFDKVNHHALYMKLMKRHIPVLLLDLIVNLFSNCSTCIKWENVYSPFFMIEFGVRQGSVLSPILFALYIDDISNSCMLAQGCFIIAYADDILLVSTSISELQHFLRICEYELDSLDMVINAKKSCCLRIGPRYDAPCATISTLNGREISWVEEIRYLGIFITRSKSLKCSLTNAKRSFFRAANAIFGKIGRFASEEVTVQLLRSKCLPILLYGLDACPLKKSDYNALDFVINRFFMKLFRTNNVNVIKYCQAQFGFELPSMLLVRRAQKFEYKYRNCTNSVCKMCSRPIVS